MFFEGAEKKVEIVLSKECPSLREKSQEYWKSLVKACNAEILSSIRNEKVDAYLLSESSLFVWDDRILMLTCGQTRLINSILLFAKEFGEEKIESLIFQRKNEFRSYEQHSSFLSDVEKLQEIFQGTALRFGKIHGHHHEMYHLKKSFSPQADDVTSELLMYDIGIETSQFFTNPKFNKREIIRQHLKLDQILPGFEIDDFCFDPFGYSLNAIKGDDYYTIHMTPQETSPYISFESSLKKEDGLEDVLRHFLTVFRPGSFDIVTFNNTLSEDWVIGEGYQRKQLFKDKISCGYDVQFGYFFKDDVPFEKPYRFEV